MSTRSVLSKLCGLAISILLLRGAARADNLVPVSTQSGQGGNDSVQWSQLGADGTLLGASLTAQSAGKINVTGSLAGPNSIVSVVCQANPCSWVGSGFTAADNVIWTADAANGGNGPFTATFATPVSGAGALIQANNPGQFTAQVQAFNGATSLGSFAVTSDANGDAAYIGVIDKSGANITSVAFSITTCAATCTDFGLDTLYMNTGSGAPAVSLVPTSLSFGNQLVGSSSTPQNVTLSNTGTAALTVMSISAAGDYSETNTCSSSVAAGASCTISITFKPNTTGTRTGSVSVMDNAPGSPQTVSLTGVGTDPSVTLSPTSLNFGNQLVGSGSAAQTVTLTNTGNATLTVTSITSSGDYSETNTCGSSVAAGATCTISITFKPTSTGTRTGTLSVTDNAPGSPQAASLTGVGTAPAVSLSPTSLAFASQLLNTSSAAQNVTLTNTGAASLTITSITASGDYFETNTCGSSVAAGAKCTITLTFKPTAIGTRTGSVSIADNAAGSPQSVSLTGPGTEVKVSPASLTFATQLMKTTSAAKVVTITNVGSSSFTISSIALSGADPGDFAQTHTCGSSLSAGASCTISVTFTPAAINSRTATLTVNDTGGGNSQSASLTGTGTEVKLSSTSLTFPSTKVGSTGSPQTVTLTNVGSSSMSVTSVTLGGADPGDFTESNTCGSSVGAGASCTLTLKFTPKATGTRTASVSIKSNGGGSSQQINLTGTGS